MHPFGAFEGIFSFAQVEIDFLVAWKDGVGFFDRKPGWGSE